MSRLRLLLSSFCLILIGICNTYSFASDLELPTKIYPSHVALKFLTNLAEVLPQNDGCFDDIRKLQDFNKIVVKVLSSSLEREDVSNLGLFKQEASVIKNILQRITVGSGFGERAQSVVQAIKLETDDLLEQAGRLDTEACLRTLLQEKAPGIAAKEFLARYQDLTERSVKCEDCGHGYFRTRTCMLCGKQVSPPVKVTSHVIARVETTTVQ